MRGQYIASTPETIPISEALIVLQQIGYEAPSRVQGFMESIRDPAELVSVTSATDQNGKTLLSIRPSEKLTAFIRQMLA
jgi:hypothetical protein